MARIKIVCSVCGSDDVRRDATAAWNVETQAWELAAVMDQGYCEGCQGDCNLTTTEVSSMRYFVMNSSYNWVEVISEVHASAGEDRNFLTNTATLNSEKFVDVNVRNIGLESLAELSRLMQSPPLYVD